MIALTMIECVEEVLSALDSFRNSADHVALGLFCVSRWRRPHPPGTRIAVIVLVVNLLTGRRVTL